MVTFICQHLTKKCCNFSLFLTLNFARELSVAKRVIVQFSARIIGVVHGTEAYTPLSSDILLFLFELRNAITKSRSQLVHYY